MEEDSFWYLQNSIKGNPIYGIFETGLLRKQFLNSVTLSLEKISVTKPLIGKGKYAAVLFMKNLDTAIFFIHGYKTYVFLKNGRALTEKDPITELPLKDLKFVLFSESPINIDSHNCDIILERNKGRKIACIDEAKFKSLTL